jgi:hypothetical protein
MEAICEEIKKDMHKMEEGNKKNRLLRYIRFNYTFIEMF